MVLRACDLLLLLQVRSILRGELLIFMSIFLVCMGAVGFTMYTLYPEHAATDDLPQVPEFGTWWMAVEAILLLGFTGQSFDFQANPKAISELGAFQKVRLVDALFPASTPQGLH